MQDKLIAPIGGDDGGGDATAAPVRREARESLGSGVPLAEEGAQRADRAHDGRHDGGRDGRPSERWPAATAEAEETPPVVVDRHELPSSSIGLPTYLRDSRGRDA
eukprot:8043289-Heterocapsa_arctica.AAC.1